MNEFKFPIVRNIAARSLADDIMPFNPGNPRHVKEWGDMFKKIYEKMEKDFDKKGIPFPDVMIDTTPGPITYGIKTTDWKLINNNNE